MWTCPPKVKWWQQHCTQTWVWLEVPARIPLLTLNLEVSSSDLYLHISPEGRVYICSNLKSVWTHVCVCARTCMGMCVCVGGAYLQAPTSQASDDNAEVWAQGKTELHLISNSLRESSSSFRRLGCRQEFVLLCDLLALLVQFHENWINEC